jgi:hypothetical protein
MSARELPWTLLLTALQRSDRARVSYSQVADAASDVAWLVREKVLVSQGTSNRAFRGSRGKGTA